MLLYKFRLLSNVIVQHLTLSEATFAPSGLAQDEGAAATGHHSLGMTEHCGDPVAAWNKRGNKYVFLFPYICFIYLLFYQVS